MAYTFPASFAQQRMWLLDRLDPGRPTYNIGWALRIDGPLDVRALERAWTEMLRRHEALRTTLREDGAGIVQVVDEPAQMPLVLDDLSAVPQPQREDAALDIVREQAMLPFDLARGPLVRARLIRLTDRSHVLGIVLHHAVADGWSVRLLFEELCSGHAAQPALQYPDFSQWQHEHAAAGGYADAEAFWRDELAGAPVELALPVDAPYPNRPGFAAAEVPVPITAEVASALRALAAERGCTTFAVVVAAYAALLSRLTSATDLLVGVPVSGRTRAEVQDVVGLFANTLAVRASLPDDPPLRRLADRLHEAIGRAQAHQEVPFARVVELLRPQRHPSRSPLVQVTCVAEERWPARRSGDLSWRGELVGNGTGKFELELSIVDDDGLGARLRYLTDLFTPETAEDIAAGLGLMLHAFATAPTLRVSEVDILRPATRELVTRVWPHAVDFGAPSAGARNVTALVTPACAGDRVVIRDRDRALTGDDLRVLARRVAVALTGLGVGVQDTVAIVLPRGAWPLPALLGTWWIGACYLPLDPGHPPLRLRGMLADAGVRVVITDRSALLHRPALLAELDASAVAVVDLAELEYADPSTAEPVSVADEPVDVPPEAAAYLLYTSGSTGRPKAVTVTHGSIVWLLLSLREVLPLGAADRVAAISTFAFDIALLDLLLPLLYGAEILAVDDDTAIDGGRLRQLLAAQGVTALQATPTTWRMLIDAGGVPASVRVRLSGGEPMPRDLANTLRDGPEVRLFNLYGPTETTIYCGGRIVDTDRGPLDIGSATVGSWMVILDRFLRPVPPGVVGEICIGGAAVSRGYPGATSLTAERYVPDPFSAQPGARMYRSGDLGRWQRSGRIEVRGRIDRQVKVRGFRVETGEIEMVLRDHPDVLDAVVVALPVADDVRLVGYVLGQEAVPPTDRLLEHARRILPEYMVPATLVVVDEVPRTGNGKVDYRALPEPDWRAGAGTAHVEPRTDLERELIEMVAQLLGRTEPIGVLDNFFVVGGHSVTATQLMARVWTRYGVDLSVRSLFDNPTMAGLAEAITTAGGGARPSDLPSFTDDEVDELLAGLGSDERGTQW